MNTAILRSRILDMAIHGQLVPQDPSEGTAADLLEQIAQTRANVNKSGHSMSAISPITTDVPFSIPENWVWVRLDGVAQYRGGFAFKSTDYTNSGVRVIRISDFNNCGLIDDEIKYHKELPSLSAFELKPHDIIMCMTGGTVGKSCILGDFPQKMYVNQRVAVIRSSDVNIQYIFTVIKSSLIQTLITSEKNSTNDNISAALINSFPIPLPPLNEQRRIVSQVEELLKQVDIIEQAQLDIRQTATILRSKILDKAFCGELTSSNTEDWVYLPIGEICKTTSGGTPQAKNSAYYDGGEIPWLQSGELHQKYVFDTAKKITQAGYDNSSAKFYPINSVLIALYGATVGAVSIAKIKTTSNQAICAIFPNERINEEFLYYFLQTKKTSYINMASGGAQPNISQEKVKHTIIPLPPLNEQRRIVAKIEELFKQIDILMLTPHLP